MVGTNPEEVWHGLLEYAAREQNPEKLMQLVVNVNRLLSVIEARLSEFDDDSAPQV